MSAKRADKWRNTEVNGALEGYRVADFGQIWAGPTVAHLLADLGAQVIHIESAAHRSSVLTQDLDVNPLLPFNNIGRNRLGVSLNMLNPDGVALAKRIVGVSDIVTENFAPGVMAKFGLDYGALRRVKPDVIMLSISGAGQTGPMRDLLAYGPSMNAVAGTDSMVGYPEDNTLMMNMWDPDPAAAIMGVYAVMVALYDRRRTGRGQHIDLSFWELLAGLIGEAFVDFQMNGRVTGPQGNLHPTMSPHGTYRCAGRDEWVSIAVETEEEWAALCAATGNPGWKRDPLFANQWERLKNRRELDEHLGRWTEQYSAEEVTRRLQKRGVASYSVLSIAGVMGDPQEQHRQQDIRTVTDSVTPGEVFYGNPWKLRKTPPTLERPAPDLGEHNALVLGDLLGLTRAEMQEFAAKKAVY